MTGIHRERPGAEDLAVATSEPAVSLGDGIWMSPGVSHSYAIATDDGRVILNGGLFFEGAQRLTAFADVPGPTKAVIVTQGLIWAHRDPYKATGSLCNLLKLPKEVVAGQTNIDDTAMGATYDWAGDELTPDVETAMKQWPTEHPQDRFALNSYTLGQYGLSVETREPVCADYLATFDIELEADA